MRELQPSSQQKKQHAPRENMPSKQKAQENVRRPGSNRPDEHENKNHKKNDPRKPQEDPTYPLQANSKKEERHRKSEVGEGDPAMPIQPRDESLEERKQPQTQH